MLQPLKPYLLSAAWLVFGLTIILGSETAGKALAIHPTLLALPAFCLFNLVLARALVLENDLQHYWLSFPLPPAAGAVLTAAVLIGVPMLGAKIGKVPIRFNPEVTSLKAGVLTFCIVGWEELWFRGLALNYLAKRTSPFAACVFFSIVFVGLHVINPQIDLKKAAANLFLASLMLSTGYFYFQSIWFPWLAHWMWNCAQGLGPEPSSGWFWGENGIFLSLLLTTAVIFFSSKIRSPADSPPAGRNSSGCGRGASMPKACPRHPQPRPYPP